MSHLPAHGDNVLFRDWSTGRGLDVPEHNPIIYVVVLTPADQSALHNHLGRIGYVSTRLAVDPDRELWRFHHPDGPKPL